MTASNLRRNAPRKTNSIYWGIKSHSHFNLDFILSKESWGVLQTLLSEIAHTEKLRRFKSGLLKGHSFLLMNIGMWPWIQFWVMHAWSLVESSMMSRRSVYDSKVTTQLLKCIADSLISLLRGQKRVETFQWVLPRPKPSRGHGILPSRYLGFGCHRYTATPKSVILTVNALFNVKFLLVTGHQVRQHAILAMRFRMFRHLSSLICCSH
jgi:hypothetical protein